MGCGGSRIGLDDIKDLLNEFRLLAENADQCPLGDSVSFLPLLKQIEQKSMLIKNRLSLLNKEIITKEDLTYFTDLNSNFQKHTAIVTRKIKEMVAINPLFEEAFQI